MCLGASNVSFGLPNRHTVNAAFLPMAAAAGLTSAIMNALSEECVTAVKAADLLLGNDPWGGNWIGAYRRAQG
jgi:5-methyltetrahydrofolate--homocysteine methyltransferase